MPPAEHGSAHIKRDGSDQRITTFFRPVSSPQTTTAPERRNSRPPRIVKSVSDSASSSYSATHARSRKHHTTSHKRSRVRSHRRLSNMEGQTIGTKAISNHQAVAYNTTKLPELLAGRPDLDAVASTRWDSDNPLPALDPAKCPKYPSSTVSVFNDDTVTTALRLEAIVNQSREELLAQHLPADAATPILPAARVALVNFANPGKPGGAYLFGANAQEEAICYRTSLYLSLAQAAYPWPEAHVLYTPDVLVHRGDARAGLPLLTELDSALSLQDLPVVGVASVAAMPGPSTQRLPGAVDGHMMQDPEVFVQAADRDMYKTKVRMTLRVLGHNGHSAIVLGALGCGVFGNPVQDAALCWREVLLEKEFRGWFSHVWFAVLGKVGHAYNFHVFSEYLAGLEV